MQKLTAIITGASQGLGKSFAIELASRNIDLVLVSLPDPALAPLAAYLSGNFGVRVTSVLLDLCDSAQCAALFGDLRRQGIVADILINNAAIGNLDRFADKCTAFYKKQIELNTISPVLLTHLFLSQVRENNASYVLNVGSLGGTFIVPMKQVYGATKSFISYFTRCLQVEMAAGNTRFCLLTPGGINTRPELLVQNGRLKGIARATILEPERVARAAVSGMFNGKKEVVPGMLNRALLWLDKLLPPAIRNNIIRQKMLGAKSH